MNSLITFFNEVFIGMPDTYVYNIPLLVTVIVVLLIAQGIAVYISKRNRLYMTPKKKEKTIRVFRRNEAA